MKKLFYLVTPLVLSLSFQLPTYADTSTDAALGDTDTTVVVNTGATPTTSTDSTGLSDVDIGLIAGGSVVAVGATATAIALAASSAASTSGETVAETVTATAFDTASANYYAAYAALQAAQKAQEEAGGIGANDALDESVMQASVATDDAFKALTEAFGE